MFFVLSKIVWALISPLNLALVLLLSGTALRFIWCKAGNFLFAAAVLLFVLCGILPTGQVLLASLENRYPQSAAPKHVDGIVILGGAFDTDLSAARGVTVLNDNAERMLEGLRLARLYPNALLVFSGGEGRLIRINHSESEDARAFLAAQGFDPDNAVYEEDSRNTWENAKFTYEMVEPQEGERWIIVTSAYHMPRSIAVFRAAGWRDIIPWPVDYRTNGNMSFLPQRFDVAGNFRKADVALHEYVGLLAYRLDNKAL